MTILQTGKSIGFLFGYGQYTGAQMVGLEYALALRTAGHRVSVITENLEEQPERGVAAACVRNGINVVELPGTLWANHLSMELLKRAEQWALRQDLDTVISVIQRDMRVAAYLKKRNSVKAVYNIQNPFIFSGGPTIRFIKRTILRRLLKSAADLVVCTSDVRKKDVLDLGASPAIVEVLQNGSEISDISPLGADQRSSIRRDLEVPEDAFVLTWAGRIDPQKGLEVLVEAIRKLKNEIGNLHVLLIGAPTIGSSAAEAYEREIRARVESGGLTGRISFLGFRRAAREIIGAGDLYIQCSHFEGPACPIPVIEAMAMARPFVISDCSGNPPELPLGTFCHVTRTGDPDDLAKAIREIYGMRDQIDGRLGPESRRHGIQFYDKHVVNGRFIQMLAAHGIL